MYESRHETVITHEFKIHIVITIHKFVYSQGNGTYYDPFEHVAESPLDNAAESPRCFLRCRFPACDSLPLTDDAPDSQIHRTTIKPSKQTNNNTHTHKDKDNNKREGRAARQQDHGRGENTICHIIC